MANDTLIEISVAGENILPGNVRSKDLADVINSVEDMIASVVVQDHPELSLSKEEIIVGLVKVEKGSLSLQFTSQLPDLVIPAYKKVAYSVRNNEFSQLPSSSVNSINTISGFARRRGCELELRTLNGGRDVLAVIRPETLVQKPPFIRGMTTIYGMIVRVGGKQPKVMLETLDGQTIYCDTKFDLAKQLGKRLYDQVGLNGTARWNPETSLLEEFIVESVSDYAPSTLTEAMKELADALGGAFDNIDNVEGYIREMRGGDLGE